MGTGSRYANFTPKRILGVTDFKDHLLDYVRTVMRDFTSLAFAMDGVITNAPVSIAAHGANRIEISSDATWADGLGHFLKTNEELAGRDIGIAFENEDTEIYSVALHYAERPRGIQINPRTGYPEFIAIEETIGNQAEPNSVTIENDDTITFRIDSVANPFLHARSAAGRRCLVWKKTPGRLATTELLAVERCTVTFTGGQNFIRTTTVGSGGVGLLGQSDSDASTTASDYYVVLLGPTITREDEADLRVKDGYAFVARVTGNGATPSVFNYDDQHDLDPSFAVDVSEITRIHNTDLKVRVTAVSGDADEAQIDVFDENNNQVWLVDKDGDMTVKGTSDLQGNVSIGNAQTDSHTLRGTLTAKNNANATLLTIDGATGAADLKGNVTVGSLDAGTHTLKGVTTLKTEANATTGQLNAATGELGLGAAVETGYRVKAKGDVKVTETLELGEDLATGPSSNALIPRIKSALHTAGVNVWKEVSGLIFGGVSNKLRLFYDSSLAGASITVNAGHDGTNWVKDTVIAPMRLMFAYSPAWALKVQYYPGTPGTFSDADWVDSINFAVTSGQHTMQNGRITFNNATSSPSGSNITKTEPIANTLCAKNLIKAWAKCSVVGATVTLVEGFNTSGSVSMPSSGDFAFILTLASPCTGNMAAFVNRHPVVTPGFQASADATAKEAEYIWYAQHIPGTAQIGIVVWNPDLNARRLPGVAAFDEDVYFDVMVLGVQ